MNIAIVGASGGIGMAFVRRLIQDPDVERIYATYRSNRPSLEHPRLEWSQLDATDETSIREWARQITDLDWLINSIGLLHTHQHMPEKTISQVDPAFFLQNMSSNTLPTLLLAKHLHRKFRHGRPAIFASLSARIGSIADNHLGGWVSYRASKAALNMCIRTIMLEWRRKLPNVCVMALHPGTTDTPLSRPFQRFVPEHQLQTPQQSADLMLDILRKAGPEQTGSFIAFDGNTIPW